MTYLDKVKEAIAHHGGEATLDEIYAYIKGHFGYRLPTAPEQSSIRKAIYFHSSDANLFKHEKDLFYSVGGKGSGVWGLRVASSKKKTTPLTKKPSPSKKKEKGYAPIPNKDMGLTEDDSGFPEGKEKLRTHLQRERNPKVIREAKQRFKAKHGRLYCQSCGFDFKKTYGDVGNDYIEGHHIKPVSDLSEGDLTMIEDIALLCSNCHRMVHRKRPWLSMNDLQDILK